MDDTPERDEEKEAVDWAETYLKKLRIEPATNPDNEDLKDILDPEESRVIAREIINHFFRLALIDPDLKMAIGHSLIQSHCSKQRGNNEPNQQPSTDWIFARGEAQYLVRASVGEDDSFLLIERRPRKTGRVYPYQVPSTTSDTDSNFEVIQIQRIDHPNNRIGSILFASQKIFDQTRGKATGDSKAALRGVNDMLGSLGGQPIDFSKFTQKPLQ
ncbi:hypothetical protein HYW44_01960 [Candidatus Daviesbacteria bacterium]|nr:hypothetical protein [Candidatus Daviesbacteria bacterium]